MLENLEIIAVIDEDSHDEYLPQCRRGGLFHLIKYKDKLYWIYEMDTSNEHMSKEERHKTTDIVIKRNCEHIRIKNLILPNMLYPWGCEFEEGDLG